jgi:hypothetical protein
MLPVFIKIIMGFLPFFATNVLNYASFQMLKKCWILRINLNCWVIVFEDVYIYTYAANWTLVFLFEFSHTGCGTSVTPASLSEVDVFLFLFSLCSQEDYVWSVNEPHLNAWTILEWVLLRLELFNLLSLSNLAQYC